MSQPPIAIVGRDCVLPGALNPEALWQAVVEGRDLLSAAPKGRWRVDSNRVLCAPHETRTDCTWSDRGGYVQGFEQIWNPEGFAVSAQSLATLDPLVHWLLHCARGALAQTQRGANHRVGAIFGNLGFPSEGMARFADEVWRGQTLSDPRNRFMSGGSAEVLKQSLALDAGSVSLDAACASSLYAIKLACDQLADGAADLMLAGAVQRADDLFLHQGFAALNALSRRGQSRPFHADADGLIPAEGCALLALKRLVDARRDGDVIYGVIRGIGLSNDGRGKGLLVPDAAGQKRAMVAAYRAANMDPVQVGLLECHATGTPVGDATELRSSAEVFAQARALPIASLKSNLGHLITVAGAAALIKVTESMRAQRRAPNLAVDAPTPVLGDTPFRLLQRVEPWPSDSARVAAISAFGFGGNNAHLIVSEDAADIALPPMAACDDRIAIVGIGCMAGRAADRAEWTEALFDQRSLRGIEGDGRIDTITLDLAGLRFPPLDLQQTLPQQLALLGVAREALAECAALPRERTGIWIGMEPDAEVARFGTRWRRAPHEDADAIIAPLTSAGVIGCMPNIPANRLSAQFDLAGPAFTVQCAAQSGLRALQIACRALRQAEVDAALVGAVDLACEPVQAAASQATNADAAVMLIVKRAKDAERDGDRVYAYIDAKDSTEPRAAESALPVSISAQIHAQLGDAGAAHGLLTLTAAALCLHHRRRPDGNPWLASSPRQIEYPLIDDEGFALREAEQHPRHAEHLGPRFHIYSGNDRGQVIAALRQGIESREGAARLVIVSDANDWPKLKDRALAHLESQAPAGSSVHYRDAPLQGEMAFAFAGAGASYSSMGRDLLLQFPELMTQLATRSQRLATALEWTLDANAGQPTAQQQLWGASALSQLHLAFSEHILGLRADAWLGYSSGETNALVAAGVWNDPDALMAEMEHSGLIDRYLGGRFEAVSAQWNQAVQWASWTVLAPVATVRAAIQDLPLVHLAIINSDQHCLLAGDAAQCQQLVQRIGAALCQELIYPLAVHVPELSAVSDAWLKLHRRTTHSPRHGRIYGNALGHAYVPESESCAQAILHQANQTLDLRPVILRAWQDGVRIFIEHGPGGSFSRAIRDILGERDALIVSLDRRGQGIGASLNAVAALLAAGVNVDYRALESRLTPRTSLPPMQRPMSFAAHWPAVQIVANAISPLPNLEHPMQSMPIARRLPSALSTPMPTGIPAPILNLPSVPASPPSAMAAQAQAQLVTAVTAGNMSDERQSVHGAIWAQLSQTHQQHLNAQQQAHLQFLALQQKAQEFLLAAIAQNVTTDRPSVLEKTAAPATPAEQFAPATNSKLQTPPSAVLPATKSKPSVEIAKVPPASKSAVNATSSIIEKSSAPSGPSFTRADLEVLADGRIADVFGESFAAQHAYARQVRMPKPPLLLTDRVLGIEGKAGSMELGRIWTETDVGSQDWYLHQDRMPPGVMIESGQADLLLISWLGVDAHNQGERVYRLLGCELTYHGDLPKRGDTLRFDIVLDGHAAQDDVRLMFFHYDCTNGDRPQLSVRKGQAGFFTDAELAESAGCLWSAEEQSIVAAPTLDAVEVESCPTELSHEQLLAYAQGDVVACFGAGFEHAHTHTRTPSIAANRTRLMDRVTALHLHGGPWQRGYVRAELDIHPDHWFFEGHFKNDPCMPGTLMFDACLQAMAIYVAACGYTLRRDGWRFQPVPEQRYALQCRGQVTPASRRLVTEVFIEERLAGPHPTIYADLLCTVDGLKAFHARRIGLELVPDWPLDRSDAATEIAVRDDVPAPVVDGFAFDHHSLMACALGRPSEAFGPMYRRFDGAARVARLPAPPYHFISRIAEVAGEIGVMRAGARVVAEYDIPQLVWYLDQNGGARMPFAVLLEAVLQPCGWLSSYVGSALTSDSELCFRNLDGEGTVLAELTGGAGTLRTEVTLTAVSASAGMIIEKFDVHCTLNNEPVYHLQTVFGFFPPAALAAQAGLPIIEAHRELLARTSNVDFDLGADTSPFFAAGDLRLAGPMLRMIDRIEGIWPNAGAAGLGQIRAIKQVRADEWFFKAHFFQDPVQPGSLGLEAMLQCLQAFVLHQLDQTTTTALRFETLALDQAHSWKYRGQVLPHHHQVHTTLEITERTEDARGILFVARASLWADGLRIYEASGLSLRVVAADS